MPYTFNRLQYDAGAYQAELAQSVAPGRYLFATPRPADALAPAPAAGGPGLVDLASELRGLGLPLSRDPRGLPRPALAADGRTCLAAGAAAAAAVPAAHDPPPMRGPGLADQLMAVAPTTLAQPKLDLRELAANRWTPMCFCVQSATPLPSVQQVIGVDTRLAAKDAYQAPTAVQCAADAAAGLPPGMPGALAPPAAAAPMLPPVPDEQLARACERLGLELSSIVAK